MKTDNRYFPPKTKATPETWCLEDYMFSSVEMVPFLGIYIIFLLGGVRYWHHFRDIFCCVSDGTSNCSLVLKSWNGLWFFTQKSEPPPPVGMTLYFKNCLGWRKTHHLPKNLTSKVMCGVKVSGGRVWSWGIQLPYNVDGWNPAPVI